MNLTSHALVGAAVAQVFPNHPLIAFWGAFGSHFVMDMVPHFDFTLFSEINESGNEMDRRLGWGWPFVKDIFRIALDYFCGFALAWYVFRPSDDYHLLLLLFCVFAATLPDALQFAYIKIRRGFLVHLQRLHIKMHARGLGSYKFLGLLSEVLAVAFITIIVKFYLL